MSSVRIANMSGFYGDRLSAAKEMVEGGEIDFLTGDYLAELTMAILHKAKLKKPELGYARSFVKQMESVMGPCLDKGIKVVVNAGGLNPQGLASALESLAKSLGLHPVIASIAGDNLIPRMEELAKKGAKLTHLDTGLDLTQSGMMPVSANAYLGCWGIVEALKKGADIVVTGRVADTSVVMAPAAFHHGWEETNWDALAGAAIAGHIIECGAQTSGGNYSNFEEVKNWNHVGFPIASISADGSSFISKHDGTGGLINTGTVTAQLLYEINAPSYITPDVVAHFDTIKLKQEGENKVSVTGIKGSPATTSSKVTVNCMGGFQNAMTFYFAGLQNEKKVDIFKKQFLHSIGGEDQFDQLKFDYFPTNKDNPQTNEEALATLKISVIDNDPQKAGKLFTSKMIEMALCSVPGFSVAAAPGPAKPRIVHFPALIDKSHISQELSLKGETIVLPEKKEYNSPFTSEHKSSTNAIQFSNLKEAYLGDVYAARSGDKGGNANLGIWGKTKEAYDFLHQFLTVDKLKEIMIDAAPFEIERYEFPNLFALNFYIKGFLEDGVAANTKIDGQAKTLGEYLRAKKVELPESLL